MNDLAFCLLAGPYDQSESGPPIRSGSTVPFALLDMTGEISGISTALVVTTACQDDDCNDEHRYLDVVVYFKDTERKFPGFEEQVTLRMQPQSGTLLAAMLSKHLAENDIGALSEAMDQVTAGRTVDGEPSSEWYR